MLHSLNFDKLPIIRFGRAFFSLDNELSQELRNQRGRVHIVLR